MLKLGIAASLLIAAALAAGALFARGDSGTARTPICAEVVEWSGSRYYGSPAPHARGAALGTAATGGCGDGGEQVAIRRLAGVPPALGLALAGRDDLVFIAEGYFPVLAGHPVHRAVFRSRATRPRRCRDPSTTSGTVSDVSPLRVSVAGGRAEPVALRVDTRIEGFLRAGHPYLRVGDRISIRARRCAHEGDLRAFADLIRPAP